MCIFFRFVAFPELTGSCAPSVVSVSENGSIPLTCSIDAEAAGITVKWFLNEQELTSVLDHNSYRIQVNLMQRSHVRVLILLRMFLTTSVHLSDYT